MTKNNGSFFGLAEMTENNQGRNFMVNHPLITTIEEFNREKHYYKIYLERINYIYKNNFDLFIL